MEQYKVSVVIPVYNGGHETGFIKRQVNSVLNQTYKNIELLLINDGSTDDSLEICNEYAKQDNRVKVISKANGGESAARNVGIYAATGDYVSVIDQDDVLSLEMYASMMHYADLYYPDVIKSDFLSVAPSGKEKAIIVDQPKGVFLSRKELEISVIPYMIGVKNDKCKKVEGHWSMIVKRTMLREHNVLYEEKLLKENDHRYMVTAFAYAQSAVFCEGTFYHWLKRAGSHTSDYSPRFWNLLNNLKFYETLFVNLYDFECEDKIKYNTAVLVDSLEYVIGHKDDCDAKKEITSILQNKEVEKWMQLLNPQTSFEKNIKNDVLNKKYSRGYNHTITHYIELRAKNLKRKIFHA